MTNPKQAIDELTLLMEKLPSFWDGKKCILEMKRVGSRHWKQMEWMGFYGEMKVLDLIEPSETFIAPGKKYGNVRFDFATSSGFNWDVKVHPWEQDVAILNDMEATDLSVSDNGLHGLLLIMVDCELEDRETQEFKQWHDELKGAPSRYVRAGIKAGRRSRLRKTAVQIVNVFPIMLDAQRIEALKPIQEDWKNSGGGGRRPKYRITNAQIIEFGKFPGFHESEKK